VAKAQEEMTTTILTILAVAVMVYLIYRLMQYLSND